MSTKFEQLLDLLVNEEMDKANDLFHEIVVEKSRSIYENLIAEEAEEENEMDESMEDEDTDESVEENMDLEDSYSMEADDEADHEFGGDASDDMLGDIETGHDEEGHGHDGDESQEDQAIFDIKNAIAELEAAFAELEQAQGGEMDHDEFGTDSDEDGEEETEGMMGFQEGRRMTREYVEKVGHDWDKNAQKGEQHKMAGAGTGDNEDEGGRNTKSPVSSGKGKPTTGATAGNIAQSTAEKESNTGTSPAKVNKGINPDKSEQFTGTDWETNSKAGGPAAGVKNLKKVGAGYPGNNKTRGPVGSGTGDKAGQTSVTQSKPFLKKL